MSDWVKEQAQQLRHKEERVQDRRDWQLHKADVIPAKGRRLWAQLIASVESDVRAFNEEFSSETTRQFEFVKMSSTITIRRTYYPDVRLTVSLNETEWCIDFERVVTRTSESDPTERTGRVRLHLDDTGELYLMSGTDSVVTCEEVSRLLLQPIFSL